MEVHILASGSDGNCAVIRHEDRAIMVDAGLSAKRIISLMNLNGLDPKEIECILITHEHSDHVSGAGPVARKLDCPVMCNQQTFDACNIGKVEHIPIDPLNTFSAAGISVMPLPTSHNAVNPVSYMFKIGGKTAVIATDTGCVTFPIEQALMEADVAVLESNYDRRMLHEGPYPYNLKKLIDSDHGHLSNVMCADILKKTDHEGRQVFLAHLSKTNNTPDVARDTVSELTGMRRFRLDCLEFPGDTRVIKI